MSETLCLKTQAHTSTTRLVTGVELADGTCFRGPRLHEDAPEEEMPLRWPEPMAERVAEFYDKYLSEESSPVFRNWNCHSFVNKVADRNVWLGRAALPVGMPKMEPGVGTDELEDGKAYQIKLFTYLRHSMLGLPDPSKNLSVWGSRGNLLVASNKITLISYSGLIYEI